MLVSIFDSLIMDIDYWDIMDNIVILIGGFICFPYSLLMITDTKDGNSKFTKGLINFALMPAVIIAILIVYLYIIKMNKSTEEVTILTSLINKELVMWEYRKKYCKYK